MARVYDFWLGGKDNYPADRVVAEQVAAAYPDVRDAVAARTHDEVRQFFTGLELVEPGVVQVHRWRPAAGDQDLDRNLAIYAGLGRKP